MNKSEKQAFVKAILADVPQVDYEDQARKLIEKAVYDAAPPEIKAVLAKPELHDYIEHRYRGTGLGGMRFYGMHQDLRMDNVKGLSELSKANEAQFAALCNLETTLTAAIAGMKTRKQIAEAFPEFVKYLPAEQGKSTNLPALTNVVNQVKAAGWTKGKQSC